MECMAKGYTCVENAFFDWLISLDGLSVADYKVLLFIIRYTVCYRRTSHKLANSFIAKGTGLSERQIIRCIHNLEALDVVRVEKEAQGVIPKYIALRGDKLGMLGVTNLNARGDKAVSARGDKAVREEINNINKQEEIKKEEKDFTDFAEVNLDDEFFSKEEWEAMRNGSL